MAEVNFNANLLTYGDLRKALSTPKSALFKKLAKAGIKLAIDYSGAGLLLTAADVAKLASRDDTKKTGTWLDKLDIDDKTALIVDDSIEAKFFKYMADQFKQRFANKSDDEKLPDDFDMNQELTDYLNTIYPKDRYVAGTPSKNRTTNVAEVNKNKIKETLKAKLKKETTGTGTGASVTPGTGEGVATKYAFGKRTNKGTPKDWKSAPSIPNRSSKAMDYKQLWETYEHLRYLVSDLKNLYYSSNDDAFKKAVVDAIPDGSQYQYILAAPEKHIQKLEVLKQMIPQVRLSNPKGATKIIDDAIAFFQNKETLQEGYAQFRNETKMRSKPDQFHQAVKEVKRKMSEINRLFEYMDRLKTELSEGEDLKYKKYTENALQQIKENAKSLFLKSTKLK